MSDILTPIKNVTVNVDDPDDHDLIVKYCYALSVKERVLIMKALLNHTESLSSLARTLDIPVSSIARHIDALTEAGLVHLAYQPGPKGHAKYYAQAILSFTVSLEALPGEEPAETEYLVEMPLGMFSHCHIKAPCGMLGKEGPLFGFDNPHLFFSPLRAGAECLWFDSGFISYNFPTDFSRIRTFSSITFSFEICSETVYYNDKWPSDITVCINNVEVTTFTSPGDFGGRRGKYTPLYWPLTSTQFGLLQKITVNAEGVFVNNVLASDKVKFDDLHVYDGTSVKLDIGIKPDAKHRGGINLFGKNFGDFPQAIVMALR